MFSFLIWLGLPNPPFWAFFKVIFYKMLGKYSSCRLRPLFPPPFSFFTINSRTQSTPFMQKSLLRKNSKQG